jgi:enoyl-CoA hydratase/carnithine racemase
MIKSQEFDDGRFEIILSRPERRNALDFEAMEALRACLKAAVSTNAKCLILRGSGGVFCAGRDLKEAATLTQEQALKQHQIWGEVFQNLRALSFPSVAIVEGAAVAGGFTLAMATDFLIAEATAKFGALEMANGFPAAMCTPILANKVHSRIGLELALFGTLETAERLHAAGLINRIAMGKEALDAEAENFITHILSLDKIAVRQTIDAYKAAQSQPYEQSLTAGITLNQLIEASGKFRQGGSKFSS